MYRDKPIALEGLERDRFGFGTRKDEESVTKSLQDSFLNILSGSAENLYSKGRLNERDFRNIVDDTSFNVGTNMGEYGMNLGINTPSPGGDFTDKYRFTVSKGFQEGGEVEEDDELGRAISEVNQLYSTQEGGANLSDQTEFMKRMAATESNFGKDKLGDYSFSAFQLDPIRYKDIQERGVGGKAKERIDVANKFLKEKLGREDFDIMNLDLTKESHNPYIGATLARLGLSSIPESVPEDLEGQAKYWKDHWNTKAGAGTPEHFISQSEAHGMGKPKNLGYGY